MAHLRYLVEEAITITIITTGVGYKDDNENEDDDATPSLLVFEPQDFVRTPSNTTVIFGAYDKAKEECGQDVAISATVIQYLCTIVAEEHAPSASDHNFNIGHLITSATYRMKITSDAEDPIYIGVDEGGGYVYVSVQDAIFGPSTGI